MIRLWMQMKWWKIARNASGCSTELFTPPQSDVIHNLENEHRIGNLDTKAEKGGDEFEPQSHHIGSRDGLEKVDLNADNEDWE